MNKLVTVTASTNVNPDSVGIMTVDENFTQDESTTKATTNVTASASTQVYQDYQDYQDGQDIENAYNSSVMG